MFRRRRSGPLVPVAAVAAVFLAAFAAFPSQAAADRVTLRNGTELQGRIESEDASKVAIRTAAGRIVVPRERVASTARQGAADSAVAIASDALARNDLPGAMAMLAGQPLGPVALAQFDRAISERADRLLLASPRPSRDDVARFSTYVDQRRATGLTSPALGVFAARWSAAAGETSAAAARLVAIGPRRLSEVPARSRSAAADILAVGAAEALAAGADPDAAATVLDILAAIAPDRASTGVTVLLGLRAARRAAAAGLSADAMDDLMRRVTPHAPAVAWAEGSALLDKAASSNDTTLTVSLAARALAGIADEPMLQAEIPGLLARQARGLLSLGRADEAETAAGRLASLDADAAAPLQHGVELLRREQSLAPAPADALGRYRLAGWAAEHGLTEDALRLYRASAVHPDLRANASLQARLVATKADLAEFEAAVELMDARRPLEALKRAEGLKSRAADPELMRRAAELAELARFRSWAGSRSRPAEAEALRQQAERLIMQSKFAEARAIVDRLDTEFADTSAGAAARRFRDQLAVRGFGPPVTRVGSAKGPVDSRAEDRAAARNAEMARLAASLAAGTKTP